MSALQLYQVLDVGNLCGNIDSSFSGPGGRFHWRIRLDEGRPEP